MKSDGKCMLKNAINGNDLTDGNVMISSLAVRKQKEINTSTIPKGNRYTTPREAYAALIDKLSGKGTWESNPYVFVYDFELIK